MYELKSDSDNPFRDFATDQTAEQVLDRAFDWRKGSDTSLIHTFMRFGYHDPFKGRIHYDTLECADGEKLYRMTIDGEPLLYSDEENFGGWMTYRPTALLDRRISPLVWL